MSSPSHMTVTPAYGRDYKSKAEAIADWNANKDFEDASYGRTGGLYVNKEQVEPTQDVNIRFNKGRSVAVIKGSSNG